MDISPHTRDIIVSAAVGFGAVILVNWTLGRALSTYERRLDARDLIGSARRRTMLSFLRRMVVAIVALLAIWNVLSLFSATESIANALLASGAVIALMAGFAFNTPLSNLGSGLLVAFTQPLRLGDRVTIGEHTGFVERMDLIYSTLVTDDDRRIYIPNSQLTSSTIVNRTITDPRRTVVADLPVVLGTPIERAREEILAAIRPLGGLAGTEAKVTVSRVEQSVVWLTVTALVPLDADVIELASEIRERSLTALAESGLLPA